MQPTQLPLKDIHLPDTIGWFPPAIGWWLVMVLIPVLVALLYWAYRRFTRKTAAIKKAKVLLLTIKKSEMNNAQKLIELSTLLRRVAISVAPRAQTASLTGQAWLKFLDSSLDGSPFTRGAGQCLAYAPYRAVAPSEQDISQLISLCEDWLKAQKIS